MRLVVDTNQASLLPIQERGGLKISLSPYVLAEILLRGNPEPTLQRLRPLDIRLGLEISDVLVELARLSPGEILEFEPFYVPGQHHRKNYEGILDALNGRRPEHLPWAQYIHDNHLEYCGSLVELSKRLRQRLRDEGKGKSKISSFEEAFSGLASTPDSFLGSVIVGSITLDGARPAQAPPAELLEAVLANQYVGRYFRMRLAYHLSISRGWADQQFNFDPSPERDDMTDIALLLYAADGDIVVTADATLSTLIVLTEPEGRITVCRADQIPPPR